MANSNVYTLEIDLNVLNHLGLNLYSNVPAVLSELIANAWDADAKNVEITISKHSEGKEIVITDDGSGMNINDLNEKFLTVGYPRRTESTKDLTPIYNRLVMGRKGIGKLSVFSIAEHIQVITKTKNGIQLGLELTLEGIREAIDSTQPYHPTPMDNFPNGISIDTSGTVIILKRLKKRIYVSLGENLRKRVARRFDVIGNEFQVKIDGDTVEPGFRDYSNLLDYALIYGAFEQSRFGCAVDRKPNIVKVDDREFTVTGWIGLIKKSGLLQEQDDNLNKISVLARGKMALEDILQSYREGGLYTKYVIGQIRADFLDETDEEDIATSSRQDFVQNDSRFIAFRKFVHKEIITIGKKREEIKDKEGEAKAREIPAINDWYEDLTGDSKKAARNLFGRINQIVTDDAHKKTLYKHGILAFEHLHHKDKLNQLQLLDIDNLEVAVQLFSDLDDIEASWYYQITEGRLGIINKLSDDITIDALEKVIQKHIYTHLWLLDPSWDRATEIPVMEKSVRARFQNISDTQETQEVKNGRLDIKYKKTSGKHVIIELKRASVRTSVWELGEQVDKYLLALKQELVRANENTAIEAICLVGQLLTGWGDLEERQKQENMLATNNIRVVTYQQLIKDAQTSYQSYLDRRPDKGRIRKLLDEIDQS